MNGLMILFGHVSACDVTGQFPRRLKAHVALCTTERLLSNMNPLVNLQLVAIFESFLAELTNVWLTRLVNQFVEAESFWRLESFPAFITFVWPRGGVGFFVSK